MALWKSKDVFENQKCCIVFKTNIRSASKNFNKLEQMLSILSHTFKIIGLSETWHSHFKDTITDCTLPGFNYISQLTKYSAGGVGLFIANSLNYRIREDLNSASDEEYSIVYFICTY